MRPAAEVDLEAVARVHAHYGIMRVRIEPSLDRLIVDYDASRLTEDQVEAVLLRSGLPLEREVASTNL